MTRKSSIRDFVIQTAREIGIDKIGISSADPLGANPKAIGTSELVIEKETTGNESPRISRYSNPSSHLKNAKSIISACHCYHDAYREKDPLRGEIAPYTRANNYEALREKLLRLADLLKTNYGAKAKVFSCYVSLAEKPIAVRAGIGYYGKNGIVITEEFGSYVVLGEILTDIEIEPHDSPVDKDCGECDLCIKACPTGAIVAPYIVERQRCLQYLSERLCIIPHKIRRIWGNRLYGCTTCQDVCPKNTNVPEIKSRIDTGYVGPSFPLKQIIMMDEPAFRKVFANNQIGMRKRNAIRRNAIIAAGNARSISLLPLLIDSSRDEDFLIRLHSYWAIAMIDGFKERALLERLIRSEENHLAKREIKTLLDGFGSIG
ncbi:MAG: tRNA epoxyqueuosine(34) reductase QueG [bacterium]